MPNYANKQSLQNRITQIPHMDAWLEISFAVRFWNENKKYDLMDTEKISLVFVLFD